MTGGASPRKRGDYFEYQTRNDLEKRGYLVARSPGSKGPFDLIALAKDRRPILISCKLGGYMSPAERRKLVEIAVKIGGHPILASRPTRGHVRYSRIVDAVTTVPLPDEPDEPAASG